MLQCSVLFSARIRVHSGEDIELTAADDSTIKRCVAMFCRQSHLIQEVYTACKPYFDMEANWIHELCSMHEGKHSSSRHASSLSSAAAVEKSMHTYWSRCCTIYSMCPPALLFM
jgi:hypothetical protein